ncbi:MAG: hypothetical protein Kow0069_33230 [Promethearchaeota archaeon]
MVVTPEELFESWLATWPKALRTWSPYVTLREPTLFKSSKEAQDAGVEFGGTFARISLMDLGTHVDLERVALLGLGSMSLEVEGHEIGHHVLCPGNSLEWARLVALVKPVFGDVDRAHLMENLFADLLVNDRLYRTRGVRVDKVYRILGGRSPLWLFYLRVYETLWKLPRGSLIGVDAASQVTDRMEVDAGLVVRILRVFENRWYVAIRKLAYVFLRYFPSAEELARTGDPSLDRHALGEGDGKDLIHALYGLARMEPDEVAASKMGELDSFDLSADSRGSGQGQTRSPAEYGTLLEALGAKVESRAAVAAFYRELAAPELVSFPKVRRSSSDPLPEGSSPWEVGDPLQELDWELTAYASPVVVPGVTTKRRSYGTDSGNEPGDAPLYLDLYVDCSGSMPNPSYSLSYPALASFIMALSALRDGAKVQATLWSDYGRFKTTDGFIDDEGELTLFLSGFISGGTGFPLNVLRDTYLDPPYPPDAPPTHVMVISDDGIDTMLNDDEFGRPGVEIAREALERCRGGGTLVLKMSEYLLQRHYDWMDVLRDVGFSIHFVTNLFQLVEFARWFSRQHYSPERS